MDVLYVDTEHDAVRLDAERGPAHAAKIARALDRLGGLAGVPCRSVPYAAASPARIAAEAPVALVIGGGTTDWEAYAAADLAGLLAVIREAPVPILGICAGHQLVGLAHGARWGPLGPLQPGEADPDPRFAPGQRKQRGFMPVRLDARCPLFAGLGDAAEVFQSHYWQLDEAPAGFAVRAHSPWSAIQAIERRDRPVFGVQFHPERYDEGHPAGATVLRNFFAVALHDANGA